MFRRQTRGTRASRRIRIVEIRIRRRERRDEFAVRKMVPAASVRAGRHRRGRFQTRAAAAAAPRGEPRRRRKGRDVRRRARPVRLRGSISSDIVGFGRNRRRNRGDIVGIRASSRGRARHRHRVARGAAGARRSPEYAPFSSGLRLGVVLNAPGAACRRSRGVRRRRARRGGDRSPSRRVDGDGLDGAARDVVREQQRMIAAFGGGGVTAGGASASGGGSNAASATTIWKPPRKACAPRNSERVRRSRTGRPSRDAARRRRRRLPKPCLRAPRTLAKTRGIRDVHAGGGSRLTAAGGAASCAAPEETRTRRARGRQTPRRRSRRAGQRRAGGDRRRAGVAPDAPPPLSEKEARRLR